MAERLWILLSVGYAVVRIVLADRFLAEYGLSIRWFAAIEIGSSLLFAVSSARFIRTIVDATHRHRLLWAFGTLIGFASPDLFVFATTRHLPKTLLVILVVVAIITLGVSAGTFTRRVRAARSG